MVEVGATQPFQHRESQTPRLMGAQTVLRREVNNNNSLL